ncbi:cell filamentation protein Fic [Candidatus Gracilibacteria bacterium]|nr:MAG: cell filamentation protein Fic [Candidatus Gracilibacteria bacterium]
MENKTGEILFYSSDEGNIKINVIFEGDTIWLSQKQIAEVFGVDISTINEHLKNIYNSGELSQEGTIGNFPIVQKEGTREVKRNISFYNLDIILSVGYRVNSYKATKFRIWANSVLKEFVIKGFSIDDERLKNGNIFGKDYFDELLARIREIRASERRFYQKITDIFATSFDYDSSSEITKNFFASVQNKFLYAVSQNTVPELIYNRADSEKINMGLTTWKFQKSGGKILSTDIKIGKNYLSENELENLNLLVSGYLDFAELQAKKGKIMKMQDWVEKTKNFLQLNDMEILVGKGKISKKQAEQKAEKEFEKFRIEQDKNYIGDFDRFLLEMRKFKK